MYFLEAVFGLLQSIHEEHNLRAALDDVEFPEDRGELRLGNICGYMGVNLDFERKSKGWVLRDAHRTR